MFTYTLTPKAVPHIPTYTNQLIEHTTSIVSIEINTVTSLIRIRSRQEIYSGALAQLDAIVPAAQPTQEIVETSIRDAINFGQNVIIKFAAENVVLGVITANMTQTLRNNTLQVLNALQIGALYDAIAEIRAIPEGNRDDTFLTDARMLQVINDIETYLGIPLSTEL